MVTNRSRWRFRESRRIPGSARRWGAIRNHAGCCPFFNDQATTQQERRTFAMGFFSKDIKNMDDLFVHTLRDIYYAERQILSALPDMAKKTNDPQLKQAFQTHLAETRNQVGRLDQIF